MTTPVIYMLFGKKVEEIGIVKHGFLRLGFIHCFPYSTVTRSWRSGLNPLMLQKIK